MLYETKVVKEAWSETVVVKEAWTEYNNRPEIIDRKSNWSRDKRYMTINGRLQQLLSGARSRALEGNYPFNLNLEDIYPEKFCPICSLTHIDDTMVLKYLIAKGYINIDNVMKEIRDNFKSFDDLLSFTASCTTKPTI